MLLTHYKQSSAWEGGREAAGLAPKPWAVGDGGLEQTESSSLLHGFAFGIGLLAVAYSLWFGDGQGSF